jgi:ubiquinone/menaquinone biosynthesis C-methylase UbiE
MPDVFANITKIPDEMVAMVADVLETRAAIPSQQDMIKSYLGEMNFPENTRVLEVGCGTGPICRVLADLPNVAEVIGVDPSTILIEKAKELSENQNKITYLEGDGKALEFDDEFFDAVILHTILTHVPDPQQILSEASRVLKEDGLLGVCDGDFATATLRTSDLDPLETCCKAFVENYVTDKYMVRKMSSLVEGAGFSVNPLRSYGLVETQTPGLTLSWIDRGADALVQAGTISEDFGEALKAEGRRRAENGNFFGYMAYASLHGQKSP